MPYRHFDQAYSLACGDPLVKRGIDASIGMFGDRFRRLADEHLERLFRFVGCDPDRFEQAYEHFLELTYDVLRMQSRYARYEIISPYSVGDHLQAVHENAALMEGPYLSGLYLAQVLWPNHFRQMLFFTEAFLPRLQGRRSLVDIGPGPGTHTVLCRLAHPALHISVVDISPFAVTMTQSLHSLVVGRRNGMFSAHRGNAVGWLADRPQEFDVAVFSEVLEHLNDPPAGLAALGRSLSPGALVFFSTATNSAFYDHTSVFKDVAIIESLLDDHGFCVLDSRQDRAYGGGTDDSGDVIDYGAVLRYRSRE